MPLTTKNKILDLKTFFIFIFWLVTNVVLASAGDYPQAKVSFEDFKGLVTAVQAHRAERLVNFDTFLAMSHETNTIIFDSRSDFRYDRIHIKGARHLSFTDFTQDNLRKIIPNFDTKILIYCNNNFDGDEVDFASKVYNPSSGTPKVLSKQFMMQEKPIMLALNIPTYINLYGYGYRNIYELDELVNVNDPRVEFEGSIVNKSKKDLNSEKFK